MTPTSETAQRFAMLMGRKLTTAWSSKEIKRFREINASKTLGLDLTLIERYYLAERKKGERGVHRRDLQTLLNNWPSELDRAVAWDIKQPRSSFQKVKQIMKEHPSLSEEQRQRNLAWIKSVAGQLHDKVSMKRDDQLAEARAMI